MRSLLKIFIYFVILTSVKAKIHNISFETQFSSDETLTKMELKSQKQPIPTIFGKMKNFSHYINVIDLIMLASQETVNCRQFIKNYILNDVKNFNTIMDVGTGSGENTQYIAQPFSKVILIDPSREALDQLNLKNLKNCSEITKINSTFQKISIENSKNDLIVFAHVFYYIPYNEWINVIEKAYNILSSDGTIFIVFNQGGTREKLVQDFGGSVIPFESFVKELEIKFPQTEVYLSKEYISTKSLEAMMQLCGLFLNDMNITASSESLKLYINKNFKISAGFQATMVQTFIKIKKQ